MVTSGFHKDNLLFYAVSQKAIFHQENDQKAGSYLLLIIIKIVERTMEISVP